MSAVRECRVSAHWTVCYSAGMLPINDQELRAESAGTDATPTSHIWKICDVKRMIMFLKRLVISDPAYMNKQTEVYNGMTDRPVAYE